MKIVTLKMMAFSQRMSLEMMVWLAVNLLTLTLIWSRFDVIHFHCHRDVWKRTWRLIKTRTSWTTL